MLEAASKRPQLSNAYAAALWWAGSLFGPEAAGGAQIIEDARETLERNGWRLALREPELVPVP